MAIAQMTSPQSHGVCPTFVPMTQRFGIILPTIHSHRADIREKFLAISRKVSPEPRTVYVHLTTSTVRLFRPVLLPKADGAVGIMNDFFFLGFRFACYKSGRVERPGWHHV
jgi:hypothetical protein